MGQQKPPPRPGLAGLAALAPTPADPDPTPAAPPPQKGAVWSSDAGRLCPACGHALAACICRTQARKQAPSTHGAPARVRRETKGRGGKTVTVITGLPLSPEALEPVGRALRQACGSGGTTRDDTIEVQGDHVQTVLAWLQKQGWKARAG